jgi:hypothetical protein
MPHSTRKREISHLQAGVQRPRMSATSRVCVNASQGCEQQDSGVQQDSGRATVCEARAKTGRNKAEEGARWCTRWRASRLQCYTQTTQPEARKRNCVRGIWLRLREGGCGRALGGVGFRCIFCQSCWALLHGVQFCWKYAGAVRLALTVLGQYGEGGRKAWGAGERRVGAAGDWGWELGGRAARDCGTEGDLGTEATVLKAERTLVRTCWRGGAGWWVLGGCRGPGSRTAPR